MSTFSHVIEEILEFTLEEKEELRDLLDRYVVEARRSELLANHEEGLAELKAGKLKAYDDMDDLLSDLKKE